MELITQAKGKVQVGRRLPVVLCIKGIRVGGSYIVLLDVVTEGLVRYANQEIGKFITSSRIHRIEVEITVVDGCCRPACFSVGTKVAQVGTNANRVGAQLPCHVIHILKDARFFRETKPRTDVIDGSIVELQVRKTVEESRRLQNI